MKKQQLKSPKPQKSELETFQDHYQEKTTAFKPKEPPNPKAKASTPGQQMHAGEAPLTGKAEKAVKAARKAQHKTVEQQNLDNIIGDPNSDGTKDQRF